MHDLDALRRRHSVRRIFAALLIGVGIHLALPGAGLAQTPRDPPTDVPSVPTSPPSVPTNPPPAPTSAPQPTARPPEDDDDDDDQDQPAPPPVATEPGVPTSAPPLRTLRPTRTPRTTATLTPTPFVAGALRLTLAAEAGAEGAAEFRVSLINQGEAPALDLTLDITVPPGLILDTVAGEPGQTARAGDLVRWYLPRLDPGAETRLSLRGAMGQDAAGRTELCATLLSAGAPLDHCASFDLSSPETAGASGLPPAALDSALPTAEPAGSVVSELPGALASGWTLVLLGLAALGVWLGLQWRGRRARSGDEQEP